MNVGSNRLAHNLSFLHRWQHPSSLLLLPDESEHHDCKDKGLHLDRRQHGHQRRVCLLSVRGFIFYIEVFKFLK